jgi:hypothetical protein
MAPPVSLKHPQRREPPPWGWQRFEPATGVGEVHVTPSWDTRPHTLSEDCGCRPHLDQYLQRMHNSFDGREKYERGAKPH